jgi:hypothetical protein
MGSNEAILEANIRIDTKGKALFLAVVAILEPPPSNMRTGFAFFIAVSVNGMGATPHRIRSVFLNISPQLPPDVNRRENTA